MLIPGTTLALDLLGPKVVDLRLYETSYVAVEYNKGNIVRVVSNDKCLRIYKCDSVYRVQHSPLQVYVASLSRLDAVILIASGDLDHLQKLGCTCKYYVRRVTMNLTGVRLLDFMTAAAHA